MALDEMNRYDGATEHREEHELNEISKLLFSIEENDRKKVIEFMRQNPDKIQDIVQSLADDYPGQPLFVAVALGSLLETALRK
jgi:hypothetical protein